MMICPTDRVPGQTPLTRQCFLLLYLLSAAAVVAYAATPLSSVPPGTSLETPHAPGGLVGTKAQAHNIELVLYQP